MPGIATLDLNAQYRSIQKELDDALLQTASGGKYILGEQVAAFEREFADYCGTKFGIGVASGTDALILALRACGIGRGDEVITAAHTAVAVVTAIEATGAVPVLVDVDRESYTMTPEATLARITPRTRAILPVHLYGSPVDLGPMLEAGRAKNMVVIEDCSQAHGAAYRGRRVGSWGDLAAFSFYPTKNLGAYGDGGMLVTDREDLAEGLRSLRRYGWRRRYVSETRGMNSRLDEIQAAILRVKLRHLERWNERRRQIAESYRRLLAGCEVGLPAADLHGRQVYHQFVIRSENRDLLQSFLADRSIGTAVHYPVPVHLQPAFTDLGHRPGDFPVTEQLSQQVLSLPIYPELPDDSVEAVCRAIREFSSNPARGASGPAQ